MKKSTKGALAAGAAAALLLGGAGSLAYWTAVGNADGGSITAGTLTLSAGTCDDWTYAAGAANAGNPVVLFVPGDKVTTTCTFTIGATGDNLSASITAPTTLNVTTTPSGTSFQADVTTAYQIDGTTIDPSTRKVTSADNGTDLTATFDVTIPYGTDESGTPKVNANDTQAITAALDSLTVTLTQDDPNA
jgi:alternate signal-mediated exported protein